MELSNITPLILTYNEENNLRRTLDGLRWATEVVIVDSFSDDRTLEIANDFKNVRVVQRKFDHFADQCNFGLDNVKSDWVLSIDADYFCPKEIVSEIRCLKEDAFVGYAVNFAYCVFGTVLRSTLYPARTVLYQKKSATYEHDGHAHRVVINGPIGKLSTRIKHDDRKTLKRWFTSQISYADLELEKIISTPKNKLGWKDKIRKRVILAPVLTLFYCLFFKLLILDGRAGMYYTLQRVIAELILSLKLLDYGLRKKSKDCNDNG